MAHRINLYHNGQRITKYFGAHIDLSVIQAEHAKLQSDIAYAKAGLSDIKMKVDNHKREMTMEYFGDWYRKQRESENNIAQSTLDRYVIDIRVFARFTGKFTLLNNITTLTIENFKRDQLSSDKNKAGININLHHLIHPFKLPMNAGS